MEIKCNDNEEEKFFKDKIKDITVLDNLKLKKLKRLDISDNKYDKEKNENLISKLEKIYKKI